MANLSRRAFAKSMAAAGAVAAAGSVQVWGANEKIRLGFIGLGNRGDQVLEAFLIQPDAQVVALCDLHQPYLDFAAQKTGGHPRLFTDYRKLLEMKEVDAVVISTPDHWHALQTIHACQAGKDVYVEKPLSLCVAEGRRMVEAVRQHNRVCQVGIHRRSVPFCREAAELIRSGVLGKIVACRAFHIQNEWPKGIDHPPDSTPPPAFDWDAWQGPAPARPYNKNRTFYRFRWFFDYSGGQLTNFGVHYMDFFHMALGVDTPLAVAAMGGKYALEDNREIPDTLEVMWEYPGGILITFTQINANAAPACARPNAELEIRGTRGTFYLYSRGYEIVPELITPNPFPARSPLTRREDAGWRTGEKPHIEAVNVKAQMNSADTTFHARNFLDCIKTRQRPHCDIATGHRSTTATLIGNIAWKTRSLLDWDAQKELFPRHPEANRLLDYPYRTQAG